MEINPAALANDLDHAWEVLAEPIQTVMRKAGVDEPYEKLKALTRGRRITRDDIRDFLQTLDLPEADHQRLLAMTPSSYVGIAAELARKA